MSGALVVFVGVWEWKQIKCGSLGIWRRAIGKEYYFFFHFNCIVIAQNEVIDFVVFSLFV